MTTTDWDLLATLIEYPDDMFVETLRASSVSARLDRPVATAVHNFERAIATQSLDDLQELYVATFDFQPGCTLEMGHHLYGERHDRGAFLADLKAGMQRRNVALSSELPDHLGVVLRLIGREDPERALALRATIAPAVQRVKDALAARTNPYVHLFEAICTALATAPSTVSAG